MLWVVDVPVACSSCIEVKSVVSVGDKASCAFLVKDVPSVFGFLIFEEFYCNSFLVVIGVISSYWLVSVIFIFECMKGD